VKRKKEEEMNIEEKLEAYLRNRFDPGARLISVEQLGEGVHGVGFRVLYRTPKGEDRLVMKSLFPSRFGHDHYADRAQVLLLANANYNEMPKHVRAIDVVGEMPEKLVSIKKAREFYIFMEEAEGRSYFEDLEEILERGSLTERDIERARMLANFLADIHSIKYRREDAGILYKRRIRDLIGHGECIMGIIDAFGPLEFTMEDDFMAYVKKCIPWWGRLRFKSERLSSVHGDYHPGNIRLQGNDFILLDRSRGSWGEPADDVSALGINFIHYAIKDRGGFAGAFADLFERFIEHYLERTGDEAIFEVCQPFFAFRTLVIANPKFYPDDAPETKRKLLEFGYAILDEKKFRIDRIPDIVGK